MSRSSQVTRVTAVVLASLLLLASGCGKSKGSRPGTTSADQKQPTQKDDSTGSSSDGNGSGFTSGGQGSSSSGTTVPPTTTTPSSPPTGSTQAESNGLDQIGFLPLPGFNADIWAHKGYAYVGSWGSGPGKCPATGVRIIDLADPAHPKVAGSVAQIAETSQEDVEVAAVATRFFRGDLLVTGVQTCTATGPRGLDLWDVTDPVHPRHLALWESTPFTANASHGVHELHLFQREGRVLVAIAVPESERLDGKGDFRIVEVTDPSHPVELSHWGARIHGGLTAGEGRSALDHSVTVSQDGKTAVLSYWDFGAIFLDISDLTHPKYIGRTVYPDQDDGNTHSAWLIEDRQLMITTDEDFSPFSGGTWGYARLWDIHNPKLPTEVGHFGTANAMKAMPPRAGIYTVHNPVVKGQKLYLSWYSDGVRVLDISSPSQPKEVAYFTPPDTKDPFGVMPTNAMVWGIYLTDKYVLASDINAGLYVLKLR